jgi:hypothetical protein
MKHQKLPRLAAAVLAVAVLLGGSGCVAVAVGAGAAGAVAYVRGELSSTLGADLPRAQNAVDKAVGQLGFAKISDRRDALEGVFVARTASDKKVEVMLKKIGDNITEIKIRVGVFGDEQISLAVLEKTKAALGVR